MLKTPYELFYIECDQGWEDLYKPLIDWVQQYNSTHKDQAKIQITQIKEKFGGLRFYVDCAPKELYDLIDKAEKESYNICEVCGTKDNVGLTINGWYSTICLSCLQKELNNHYQNVKHWRRNSDKKVFLVTKDSVKEIEDNHEDN